MCFGLKGRWNEIGRAVRIFQKRNNCAVAVASTDGGGVDYACGANDFVVGGDYVSGG